MWTHLELLNAFCNRMKIPAKKSEIIIFYIKCQQRYIFQNQCCPNIPRIYWGSHFYHCWRYAGQGTSHNLKSTSRVAPYLSSLEIHFFRMKRLIISPITAITHGLVGAKHLLRFPPCIPLHETNQKNYEFSYNSAIPSNLNGLNVGLQNSETYYHASSVALFLSILRPPLNRVQCSSCRTNRILCLLGSFTDADERENYQRIVWHIQELLRRKYQIL